MSTANFQRRWSQVLSGEGKTWMLTSIIISDLAETPPWKQAAAVGKSVSGNLSWEIQGLHSRAPSAVSPANQLVTGSLGPQSHLPSKPTVEERHEKRGPLFPKVRWVKPTLSGNTGALRKLLTVMKNRVFTGDNSNSWSKPSLVTMKSYQFCC